MDIIDLEKEAQNLKDHCVWFLKLIKKHNRVPMGKRIRPFLILLHRQYVQKQAMEARSQIRMGNYTNAGELIKIIKTEEEAMLKL